MSGPVLSGSITALLTPLDARGGLDEEALSRLVARVLDGGVDGVSPAGSTGEGARLTRAQRLRLTALVTEQVAGRVPVYPAVPLTSLADGLEELAVLAGLGAAAALVAPPAYYPLPDEDVLRLYETLADAAPLPLVLYHIPVFTGVRVAPGVAGRLAAHPRVAGLKDSGRDLEYLQHVLRATEGASGFSVLTGTDTLLVPSLDLGARGAVAAGGNYAPALGVALTRAWRAGDRDEALRLQRRVADLVRICRTGHFPAGWKAALAHAGVCRADPAPPASPLPAERRAELARELEKWEEG